MRQGRSSQEEYLSQLKVTLEKDPNLKTALDTPLDVVGPGSV